MEGKSKGPLEVGVCFKSALSELQVEECVLRTSGHSVPNGKTSSWAGNAWPGVCRKEAEKRHFWCFSQDHGAADLGRAQKMSRTTQSMCLK